MNRITILTITTLAFIYSCTNKQSSEAPYTGPQIIETTGNVVPMDSVEKPVEVAIDQTKLKKVRAGKPNVVPIKSNVHPAGKPRIVKAGRPVVCTPGKDTFLMPKKVVAVFNIVLAETPEVVLAKEASSKEHNPFSFSSYGVKNGLKTNCMTTIFEDKTGNIWIGMCDEYGVTKFDGKNFIKFNKNRILYKVNSILEDKRGNIWFGGEDGILKYDGKYFTNFINRDIPVNTRIFSLLEDVSGNIWIGTDGQGLLKYDGQHFTHFTSKNGLVNETINDMCEDNIGNLCLGTVGGLSIYDGTSFTNYKEKEGLSNVLVNSVQKDNRGFLWLGTYGSGVFKFEGNSFLQYTEKEGLSNNYILTVTQDRKGNLWFNTEGNGICVFDRTSFTHFGEKEGFIDEGVQGGQNILEDKHGNFWFATFNEGLFKYSGSHFTHITEKEGLNGNSIGGILDDKHQNIWFPIYGKGVTFFDEKSYQSLTKKEGLDDDRVWSLDVDKNDHLWLGTEAGLIKYDGQFFTNITSMDVVSESTIYSILEDNNANLWFGKFKGLYKITGNLMTQYTTKNGLTNNTIYTLMEDKNRNIWLGTDYGVGKMTPITLNGSVKYSITNFTEAHGIGKGSVRSLLEDTHGIVWVGTMNGLSKIEQKEFKGKQQYLITNFTTKEGLSSDAIYSIYQDKEENIWIGTGTGLNKLTQKKLNELNEKVANKNITDSDVFFKNYNQNDGFLGIGVYGGKTIYEDKKGKLWIGAFERLTILNPDGESRDSSLPNIDITDIDLFNENINWNNLQNKQDTTIRLGNGVRFKNFEYDSTGKWYGLPQNLSLAYNNNYITFRFVCCTQNQPHKVKYKYQLVGLEENWSVLTDKNEAQYGNLPFGHYTFMVKSMNSEGLWSEPVEYNFTIRPPWYRTWCAYGIYLMLISYAGWKLHQYQKAKTIAKEHEKARERELEHAKEIEIAYTKLGTAHENLKTSQAQLIQSEKMASLGELTAGIAHEIQNPLNFVNNFSELSVDLAKELKEEIDKVDIPEKDKDYISDILSDLNQNQEKINHHGKRASSIVKGMLEHSRKSSGTKEPTDINALADEYLKLVYQSLRAKDKDFNAELITNYDPNLPQIEVVTQDIGRVLLNLITNAFYSVNERSKKGETGYEPKLSITTQLTANSQLLIAIKDTGSGIPEAIKDKIFQPFFTTKPTGQGTGLGLSLSYDIVKAHGGELRVESKEGEGSAFIIQIPL